MPSTLSKMQLASLLLVSLLKPVLAATYTMSDNVVGNDFFEFFEFETIKDPSNGRVNWVDETVIREKKLAYTRDSGNFVLQADSETILDPSGPGRDAWRAKSRTTYTKHVTVFDLYHVPQGCGTWPGLREKNETKGNSGGLIDILEGVNDLPPNQSSLHTNPKCMMPAERSQTGNSQGFDCDESASKGSGCGVKFPPSSAGFGPDFNREGGGIYAVERTSSYIKVFFWPRSGGIPSDIKNNANNIDTDNWGTPVAYFPDTYCNIDDHFVDHNILISMTFCGGWAGGQAYQDAGCPSTCVDFVNNNPGAFSNAYFEFASIRVYE